MAKTSMKFKATRTPKFPTLTRVRSRALRRQAGKEGEKSYADYRCNCRYAHKNS